MAMMSAFRMKKSKSKDVLATVAGAPGLESIDEGGTLLEVGVDLLASGLVLFCFLLLGDMVEMAEKRVDRD